MCTFVCWIDKHSFEAQHTLLKPNDWMGDWKIFQTNVKAKSLILWSNKNSIFGNLHNVQMPSLTKTSIVTKSVPFTNNSWQKFTNERILNADSNGRICNVRNSKFLGSFESIWGLITTKENSWVPVNHVESKKFWCLSWEHKTQGLHGHCCTDFVNEWKMFWFGWKFENIRVKIA